MDLRGHAVLEVGQYVSAPYAGKLLSDLGARVLKVEPPGGDVARDVGPFGEGRPRTDASAFFGYLNTGKESVTLARNGSAPGVLTGLIEAADVDLVIEEDLESYGVDPAALSAAYPDVSVVSLSGFGRSGPFQDYAAPDIVLAAESGQMNKMGYPDRPPTRMRIKSLEYLSGIYAAAAGLTALVARERGQPGQHVDLAKRETGIASLAFFITGYSWSGDTTERTGDGFPLQDDDTHSKMIYEATDGHVSVSPSRWEAFCEDVIDRPDLVEDERFATRQARRENIEDLRTVIEENLLDRQKWNVFNDLQAAGMPSAVTTTVTDIADFEHLQARDFWRTVELPTGEAVTMPGFPFLVEGDRPEMERAPRLGEHDVDIEDRPTGDASPPPARGDAGGDIAESGSDPSVAHGQARDAESGPLEGVRVLDLTWVVAGPLATKILAALGADVVKIESSENPDVLRQTRGFDFDTVENPDVSAFWHEYNQGKRSVELDLTSERGGEIVRSLVAEADVVAENFSPGFMERIGLDHETIHEINPEAVYVSMPGWGNEGPAKDYRAYGLNIQSMAGLDALSGFPGDPPTTAGHSWPDYQAGPLGAVAVLAGLLERERTGEGTYLEVPQYEMAVSLLHKPLVNYFLHDELPDRVGNRDEDRRYVQGAYECAGEDQWAVVAIETDDQWRRLCEAIDRPSLAEDDRFAGHDARLAHHDEIDDVIEAWTSRRSPETVRVLLQDADVPAGMVADERDLVEYDPQLRVREFFNEHDHPEVGRQTYSPVPISLGRSATDLSTRPPLLGEHTDEVLREWLEFSDAEVEGAVDSDAVR